MRWGGGLEALPVPRHLLASGLHTRAIFGRGLCRLCIGMHRHICAYARFNDRGGQAITRTHLQGLHKYGYMAYSLCGSVPVEVSSLMAYFACTEPVTSSPSLAIVAIHHQVAAVIP